jgi:cytochrome c oxidase subunit 5a
MQSVTLLRAAARGCSLRAAAAARPAAPLMARPVTAAAVNFSTSVPRRSEHAEETFEEFSAR